MKLLVDENLSDKLVTWLDVVFPGSRHVKQLGLQSKPDDHVWEFARSGGFIILTQDDDFIEMNALLGYPPKVIHLALGNRTTAQWRAIIEASAETFVRFA